ncbi:MAG: helix-turn-helix domain-containing protein [Alphaproteobacteria bacterium]|nr:helix-turn-helix domain-containing protein [Alphaproteobacteria bacterium]
MNDFMLSPDDRCLKTSEAAEFLGLSPKTLKSYRADGLGPHFVKFGKMIRYRLSDVKHWRDSFLCAPVIKKKKKI